jgi:hypothetical protein
MRLFGRCLLLCQPTLRRVAAALGPDGRGALPIQGCVERGGYTPEGTPQTVKSCRPIPATIARAACS